MNESVTIKTKEMYTSTLIDEVFGKGVQINNSDTIVHVC